MTLLQAFEAQSTNLFCKRQTNRAIFYLFHSTFLRCQDLATRFDLPLLADGGSLGCLCDALCRKKGEKDCNLPALCRCRTRAYCLFVDEGFFAPSRWLFIAPVGLSSHLSLIDVCETSTDIRFALLRLFHCLLPPNHRLLPSNHRLLPPTHCLLPPNEKTLSGVRQLFVFRRKRSDVRHTISLSRRSRFLTPLSSLRHRERQKGGRGVKGLHLSLHWQADCHNE